MKNVGEYIQIRTKTLWKSKKVSELSTLLSASEISQCEKLAIDKCNLNYVLPITSNPLKNSNQEVVETFEQLFNSISKSIRKVSIRNQLQAGVFASKDYLPNEPIFIYGVLTKTFSKDTISSTHKGELLLGPLRCLNTSQVTNSKYLETSLTNIYIAVATKRIEPHEQILVNYKPGCSSDFWVIFFIISF